MPATAAIDLWWTPYFNYNTPANQGGDDYAHYNTSAQLAERIAPSSTPWELWLGSLVMAVVLFLYSLRPVRSIDELESSIIVAAMSAVSAAYCIYGSFKIDRLAGFGVTSELVNQSTIPPSTYIYNHEYVYMENHLIYTEPTVAIIMTIFFFVIVGFTIYRVGKHRAVLGTQMVGEDEDTL